MHTTHDFMEHPTGVGSDVLLSTLINHVASREGLIDAAELNLIFGIMSSLSGRISPEALAMAHSKLSAVMTAHEHDARPTSPVEAAAVPMDEPQMPAPAFGDREQASYDAGESLPAAHEAEDNTLAHADAPAVHLAESVAAVAVEENTGENEGADEGEDAEYQMAFTDILDQPHLEGQGASPFAESVSEGSGPAAGHTRRAGDGAAPSPLQEAATCEPAALVRLAQSRNPAPQLCNLIVARGNPEALAAIARNPEARFAKSSLTTMVELAASDLSIRMALCSRADLTDMILDRLWPYLSRPAKAAVIASGCRESHAEAVLLCREVLQAADKTEEDASGMTSAAEWNASIEARQVTLCNAMRTLDAEGRIAEVAMILAIRSRLSPEMALTLLLGRYDRGAVALARMAGCDDDSLSTLVHVRGRAGARGTADSRGPLHAFAKLSEDEARGMIESLAPLLERETANDAASEALKIVSAAPGLASGLSIAA
jgi:Uncharacterised protein conserved in bacteria (DUF2336)